MSSSHIAVQLLMTSALVFLLAGSLLGLLIGIGLLLRTASTLRFLHWMNRWVSTRQAFKSLELPLQIAQAAAGARWFGAVLIALGSYTAVVLMAAFDANGIAALLKVDSRYSLAAIGIHAAKWLLVLGSLMTVGTGIMLLFFPRAWRRVEASANRWYATGNLEDSEDTMYLSLERIVEAFPRASGATILALSLATTIGFGLLIFR